jgi:hypothetical protein
VVESGALLKRCTSKGYRGFESLPHRCFPWGTSAEAGLRVVPSCRDLFPLMRIQTHEFARNAVLNGGYRATKILTFRAETRRNRMSKRPVLKSGSREMNRIHFNMPFSRERIARPLAFA